MPNPHPTYEDVVFADIKAGIIEKYDRAFGEWIE